MEQGTSDKDGLLRLQLGAMSWQRFEQVVFELAKREDPGVERLQAPDGGADVLLPASDGSAARVWQAKHYTSGGINWKSCEKSLRRSSKIWSPDRVTFAFPVDFTAARIKAFDERLVEPGTQLGISVDRWGLSEIVSRLDEHSDLKVRFFGSSQEAVVDAVDRVMQTGGRLESGGDLLKRAGAVADFTEAADPDFTYMTSAGGVDAPAPNWDELPYMSLSVGDGQKRVDLASWSREGSDVELPTFSFAADEDGQKARQDAVWQLAKGEDAVLTTGAHLRFQAPALFKDLIEEVKPEGGELRIRPGDPLHAEISIRTEAEKLDSPVDFRPVPWPEGVNAAFAGYVGNALFELDIVLLEPPAFSMNVRLSGQLGTSASENLEMTRWMVAFLDHTELILFSEDLFPETRELRGDFSKNEATELLESMKARRDFYADLVLIEERTPCRFDVPDQATPYDVNSAATAAQVLRDGGGTATFGRTEGYVENPLEIPRLPEEFRKKGSDDREVIYEVFGEPVNLGVGRYELPELKIVEVAAQGDRPDVPARVVLEAVDDDQIRFHLLDQSGELKGQQSGS